MIPIVQCDETDNFGAVIHAQWLELSAQGNTGTVWVRERSGLIVEVSAQSDPNLLNGRAYDLLGRFGSARFRDNREITIREDGTDDSATWPNDPTKRPTGPF